MSIVAWDGKSIAADKMATNFDMSFECSKLGLQFYENSRQFKAIGFVGDLQEGITLTDWYMNGPTVDTWPKFQTRDNFSRLIVADRNGVIVYEYLPVPIRVAEPFMAWGSGRDFAMGAMAMGASAKEPVEIAIRFNVFCGKGVEVCELNKEWEWK